MSLLLVQAALFVAIGALLATSYLLDRSALRSVEYVRFETRAVRAQRFGLAALVLLHVEILIAAPLGGVVLALAAIAWSVWWLPASHRRFAVGVESTFAAPPEAVAAVMFDISQQPRWMESIVSATLVTPGLLRLGSVVRQVVRIKGHDLAARLVVTDLVPYERMTLTLQVHYASPEDIFELLSHPRGSLVKYSGRHEQSRVAAILGGWALPSLRRQFRDRRAANLERLRRIVETTPLVRTTAAEP